jgi:hypothetical protein
MATPQKHARAAVASALLSGRLVRPENCERCGKETLDLQAHHWSYAREHRLEIEWLCGGCHKSEHPLGSEKAREMIAKRWAKNPVVKCRVCGKSHRCRAGAATVDELIESGVVTTADKLDSGTRVGSIPTPAATTEHRVLGSGGQSSVERAKEEAAKRFLKLHEK